ncbi:MAG: hypothetical protein COB66_01015 [Coxiella sp. (in: Bacteria)]|nr:MAG: hypothetical protein COB66_01015 [Coxiella sp. (in: g-proteobacteria)]
MGPINIGQSDFMHKFEEVTDRLERARKESPATYKCFIEQLRIFMCYVTIKQIMGERHVDVWNAARPPGSNIVGYNAVPETEIIGHLDFLFRVMQHTFDKQESDDTKMINFLGGTNPVSKAILGYLHDCDNIDGMLHYLQKDLNDNKCQNLNDCITYWEQGYAAYTKKIPWFEWIQHNTLLSAKRVHDNTPLAVLTSLIAWCVKGVSRRAILPGIVNLCSLLVVYHSPTRILTAIPGVFKTVAIIGAVQLCTGSTVKPTLRTATTIRNYHHVPRLYAGWVLGIFNFMMSAMSAFLLADNLILYSGLVLLVMSPVLSWLITKSLTYAGEKRGVLKQDVAFVSLILTTLGASCMRLIVGNVLAEKRMLTLLEVYFQSIVDDPGQEITDFNLLVEEWFHPSNWFSRREFVAVEGYQMPGRYLVSSCDPAKFQVDGGPCVEPVTDLFCGIDANSNFSAVVESCKLPRDEIPNEIFAPVGCELTYVSPGGSSVILFKVAVADEGRVAAKYASVILDERTETRIEYVEETVRPWRAAIAGGPCLPR